MIIQPGYATFAASTTKTFLAGRQALATEMARFADNTVTISQAAREALTSYEGSTTPPIDSKLEEIKAKTGPLDRTPEEMDYLITHDTKLAAIYEKMNSGAALTSSEIDYEQKTIGFVNTMAALSPAEKQMYDDMVASGNSAAAAGISQIAFIRTMGHLAGGADGTTYDPINTEITAANVVKYFMNTIVDKTGKSEAQFQALVQYLENRPSHSASSSTGVQA